MNKKRLDWSAIRSMLPVLALAVMLAASIRIQEAPALMTAVATRELPVYNVDTQEKVLSISFDAAWGRANTEEIMNILDRFDVKTTFFLVGFWAEKHPYEAAIKELEAHIYELEVS